MNQDTTFWNAATVFETVFEC